MDFSKDFLLCVLDCETTGLETLFKNKVVAVAAHFLHWNSQSGQLKDTEHSKQWYINPLRESEPDAARIHRLSQSFLERHPTINTQLPSIIDWITNTHKDIQETYGTLPLWLTAYKASFDIGFLNNEMQAVYSKHKTFAQATGAEGVLCALRLFENMASQHGYFGGLSMNSFCKWCKVDTSPRYNSDGQEFHGALVDCSLLAKSLAWLAQKQYFLVSCNKSLLDANALASTDSQNEPDFLFLNADTYSQVIAFESTHQAIRQHSAETTGIKEGRHINFSKDFLLCVIDCKTTGRETQFENKIVSFAAHFLRWDSRSKQFRGIRRSKQWHINPQCESDPGAARKHGFSQSFLELQPSIEAQLPAIIEWLTSAYKNTQEKYGSIPLWLAAHNAAFNIGFLNAEMQAVYGSGQTFAQAVEAEGLLCILQLFKNIASQHEEDWSFRLSDFCQWCKVDTSPRYNADGQEIHDTLIDCKMLAKSLSWLTQKPYFFVSCNKSLMDADSIASTDSQNEPNFLFLATGSYDQAVDSKSVYEMHAKQAAASAAQQQKSAGLLTQLAISHKEKLLNRTVPRGRRRDSFMQRTIKREIHRAGSNFLRSSRNGSFIERALKSEMRYIVRSFLYRIFGGLLRSSDKRR